MERTAVDAYVFTTLMADLCGHDHRPSAFLVWLYLWHRFAAAGRRAVRISYAELAVETGLSRASVQTAVAHLRRRQLLHAVQAGRTAVPAYTVLRPWRRRGAAG